MKAGYLHFLCTGDCYRRDEIDHRHYPTFHQMEGVKVFPKDPLITTDIVVKDLKDTVEAMVDAIFGKVQKRWVDAYFPFTDPSLELEVYCKDIWMEMLGSGVIHTQLLNNCNLKGQKGWAFGLGLERLAMVLFNIPDIRLFWSLDPRFLNQFKSNDIVQFKPYSKYPKTSRDLSVWWPDEKVHAFHENDYYSIVREEAGDLVENVSLVSSFIHPKTNRKSNHYRTEYRAHDRTLTDEEVNIIEERIRGRVKTIPGVEIR